MVMWIFFTDAFSNARFLCEQYYLTAPDINIECHNSKLCCFPRSHSSNLTKLATGSGERLPFGHSTSELLQIRKCLQELNFSLILTNKLPRKFKVFTNIENTFC